MLLSIVRLEKNFPKISHGNDILRDSVVIDDVTWDYYLNTIEIKLCVELDI